MSHFRVNPIILLCGFLLFQITNCVEFEEEYWKGGERDAPPAPPQQSEGRGFGGILGLGGGDWQSGLFDFDTADFFSPQSRSELTPKKTSAAGDKDREPLDVDFVSSSIGGHSVGATGDDEVISSANPGGIGAAGAYPFFPFGNVFGSNFGFGSSFPFNFGNQNGYKPWWRGENVCVEREEDIEDWESPQSGNNGFGFSLNFETCQDKPNKHVCTSVTNYQGKKRSVTTTRQCCHGYAASREHAGHCKKIDLATIMETAEKMGAGEFIRSAKNNGLEEKLSENITLFLPLDAAFTDFSEQMFESNLVVLPLARSRRSANDVSGISTKQLGLNHIVKGFLNIEDIENEQLLPTEYENSTIRVNVFPRPPGERSFDEYPFKYTANCVPMTSLNKPATNGVIHTVERVLVPVSQTLMEMVQSRSDLVVFRTVLEKTDFMEQLDNQDKTFTVFAPNDNAFSKLEPNIRRIVKDGNACTLNILKNHILDLTFCSVAVSEKAKTNTFNLLGEKLLFERQVSEVSNGSESQDLAGDSDIVINKLAKVLESDLMATNGVLHVIDTVLETDSGTPMTKVLGNHNLTIFKQLVEASGIDDTINLMSNASFFVPTDKAFENSKWKTELENNPESLKDNADLRKFLEYHIGLPYVKTCNLSEEMIQTATGDQLRINLYSTHPIFSNVINRATVNCARLVSYDVDSCGSVLHQVDKPLEPPKASLLELLEANKKYSKFLNLIREANLTDLIAEEGKEYTILVPGDDVFAEQEEWYAKLLQDSEKLERIVKSHILPDVLCCTGFVRSEWPFVRTIQTVDNKSVRIDRNRRPLIGNAAVIKCDVVATNGVLHEVNDVIIIKEARQPPAFF